MYTFGPLIAKNSRSGRLLGGAPVTVTTLAGVTLTTTPTPLVTNHEGYLPTFTADTDQRVILARPRGGDPLPLYAHEGIQDAAEAADTINTGRLSEDALESTIATETDRIVPGKVADALADDDTVAQAAAAAAVNAIDEQGGIVDPVIASVIANSESDTRAELALMLAWTSRDANIVADPHFLNPSLTAARLARAGVRHWTRTGEGGSNTGHFLGQTLTPRPDMRFYFAPSVDSLVPAIFGARYRFAATVRQTPGHARLAVERIATNNSYEILPVSEWQEGGQWENNLEATWDVPHATRAFGLLVEFQETVSSIRIYAGYASGVQIVDSD